MIIKDKEHIIDDISNKLLYEVLFTEKKNFNTKDMKDTEMVKHIKKLVEREVKKYEIQKDEN